MEPRAPSRGVEAIEVYHLDTPHEVQDLDDHERKPVHRSVVYEVIDWAWCTVRSIDVRVTPVALKLILGPTDGGERAERFARETALLASLDHPRIAKYVHHGSTPNGQAFFAMEWLEGEDLGAVLARRRLTLAESICVLRGAAEAVRAVHAQGIIPRDLKPSNLLLRRSAPSDLVLIDFGVARRLEEDNRLTASAALVGTPHYMAPEQASSSRDIRPAADIFALGCIFYECVTGSHPFKAGQLAGVLARILFDRRGDQGRLPRGDRCVVSGFDAD